MKPHWLFAMTGIFIALIAPYACGREKRPNVLFLVTDDQLFHLRVDPDELKNLAADAGHTMKVRELMDILGRQQKVFHDPSPLRIDNPQPAEVDESFFKSVKPKMK